MEEEDIMDAIIYTTNTGSTERYARLLSHETGLPAYSAAEAGKKVSAGARGLVLCDVRRRGSEDRDDGACEDTYAVKPWKIRICTAPCTQAA